MQNLRALLIQEGGVEFVIYLGEYRHRGKGWWFQHLGRLRQEEQKFRIIPATWRVGIQLVEHRP